MTRDSARLITVVAIVVRMSQPIPATLTATAPAGSGSRYVAHRAGAAGWRRLSTTFGFLLAHVTFWATSAAAVLLVDAVYRPDHAESPAILAGRIGSMFLATAGMRWLSKQPGLLQRLDVSWAGLVIGGLLTAAVVITLGFAALETAAVGIAARPTRGRLAADLAVNVTLLANWCAMYFGWQLIRARSEAEVRAIEAESLALKNELHRLQAQISPHFLFNALNTVLACRDKPDDIETITQSLAAYLRFLLRPAAALEPLSLELDALEHYLTVQSMRFGDGVVTRIDCDLDVRHELVPPVLVQPLVENALKYGAASGPRPLRLEISARRDGDCLAIEVANTGRWAPRGGDRSTGTGLRSVERRLQILLGGHSQVTHMEADGWVRVGLRIPLGHGGAEPREGEA